MRPIAYVMKLCLNLGVFMIIMIEESAHLI